MGTHLQWPAPVEAPAEAGPTLHNPSTDLTHHNATLYVATAFWSEVTRRRLPLVAAHQRASADVTVAALDTLGRIVSRASMPGSVSAFIDGGTTLWYVNVQPSSGSWYVVIAAADDAASAAATAQLTLLLPSNREDDGCVPMRFWSLSPCNDPDWFVRRVEAQAWSEIAANYTAVARDALDTLANLSGPPANGRLVLLYGPPGTGKTTFIRSLALAWRPWADASYIVDPEKLFAVPGYLLGVVTDQFSDEGDVTRPRRWKLLVIEDADELLLADAKERSGQALSRLLNLTDGLLGEGLRLVLLLTTNVDFVRVHPALRRPGRCLANVDVGALSVAEAAAWLDAHGRADVQVSQPATVAELYERIGDQRIAAEPAREVMAGYL
jgi:hypothetical protein